MDNAGFTPIRNGILEHLEQRKMTLMEFGVYMLIQLRADWATGIYRGCALTIAYQFGEPNMRAQVKDVLFRLRKKGYINHSPLKGQRGSYQILIHKFEPRVGRLSGTRLNAWKHGEEAIPEYERVATESPEARPRVATESPEARPNKEIRSKEVKSKGEPSPIFPDLPPTEASRMFLIHEDVCIPSTTFELQDTRAGIEAIMGQEKLGCKAALDWAIERYRKCKAAGKKTGPGWMRRAGYNDMAPKKPKHTTPDTITQHLAEREKQKALVDAEWDAEAD